MAFVAGIFGCKILKVYLSEGGELRFKDEALNCWSKCCEGEMGDFCWWVFIYTL